MVGWARRGPGHYLCPVLRSLRALVLFWTLFASYGLTWLLASISGKERADRLFERAHRKNARRLTRGFTDLGGVFIKMGQVLSVTGTFLPTAYGEALESLQDQVPPRPFKEIEARLEEAFGASPLERFASFSREPIAAASLATFSAYRPTVVLLDIGLPDMDGYEVARRAREQSNGVTLIALTGWGQEDDRRRSKDAGIDHHLVKPVDFDALERVLAALPAV